MSFTPNCQTRKKKRSLLFLKFLLSYILLVGLILLVISVSLYGVFFRTLKSEVEILASNNLVDMCRFMDTKFYEMDRIAYEVSKNPSMLSHVVYQDRYAALQMSQTLDSYRRSNTFITDILVYYNTSIAEKYNSAVEFFTANGNYDPASLLGYLYHFDRWNYDEFTMQVQTVTAPVIRPVEGVVIERLEKKEFIVYICPTYNSGTPVNERGVVVFFIDRENLEKTIRNNLKEYNGVFGFFDPRNVNIFTQSFDQSMNAITIASDFYDVPFGTPAMDTVTIDGEQYTRIMLRSSYNQYAYVLQMPSRLYLSRIYSNMALFNTTLAVAAFLGLLGAYLLSVQNYRPIHRLITTFAKYNTKAAKERTDLSLISATFDELKQKNETLTYRLKSQEGLYRLQFLQNLLHGRYAREEEIEAAAKECDLNFGASYFTVWVIMIDRSKAITNDNNIAYVELLKYSIINMLEEITTADGNTGYGLDAGASGNIVLILNLKDCKDARDFCGKVSKGLTDFFKTNFGYTLTIGVGSCCDTPLSIPLSYRQATDALSYRFLFGIDRTFFYEDIRDASHRDIQWYPIDREKQVMQFIMQGSYSQVESGVNSIISSINLMKLPPDIARGICFGLVNSLKKALGNMRFQLEGPLVAQLDRLLAMEYDTLWDYQTDLLSFSKGVCETICTAHESKNYHLKEEIESYVGNHYSDSMLSLEAIARHFDMSPSYLTRYYKDHTGIPLMQYVDDIRMENVRILLATTHLPLGDIIERTGYVDKSNFIRKFKKRFGTTPILYRKNMQEQSR